MSENSEKTEVIYGIDNIIKRAIQGLSIITKTEDCVFASNGLAAFIPIEILKNQYQLLKERGVRVRFITEVLKEDISYCKEAMKFAELRHLEGIKGNFGVHDRIEYTATAILEKTGSPTQRLIYSNVKEIVEQHQYLFETLWSKAIPADQKITEIEEGIEPEVIQTIRDPVEIQKISFDLIRSAKEEILIVFPTANALYLQEKAGVVQALQQISVAADNQEENNNIQIKILTPLNEVIKGRIHELQEENIDIRYIEPPIQTRVTILVVDRRYSLVVELKDDSKNNYYESIGLATYSNSKSTVLSYASIFESLWTQTKLYHQLKDANEQLKIHDKMQKEFINIAAHELRSPIQPILGLTEILRNKAAADKEQQKLHDAVFRSAKKLKQLTEDILDVTRIESQSSLQLHKEQFDDIEYY